MLHPTSILWVAIVCAIAFCDRGSFAEAAELVEATSVALPEKVSFNVHIRPIFAKHCVSCHGGVKQASGLSLIYREQALADAESGLAPIVPGAADESYLMDRVTDADPETRMPPGEHGPALSEHQVALLRRWIEQGAEWEQHWSFVAPKEQEIPQVQREHWSRTAPTKDAASIRDLHATILHLMGMNHEKLIFPFQGLDQKLTGVQKASVITPILA